VPRFAPIQRLIHDVTGDLHIVVAAKNNKNNLEKSR
jgi:hypothetical protein